MINFKNVAENMLIAFVFTIVGLLGGYVIAINAAKTMVDTQKSIIEKAIRKETTSINNSFKTEIKKLKVKKDGRVDLAIEPVLDTEATTIHSTDKDSLVTENKGFFKRIFGKKK